MSESWPVFYNKGINSRAAARRRKGAPLWTLELQVEPDKGSPSL
jgi:hypothetical protein